MAIEIERKFLLGNDEWRSLVHKKVFMRQAYFYGGTKASIRVRIAGDLAKLNIKSATLGMSRSEYDYTIPLSDAQEIMDKLCIKPIIEKFRHYVTYDENLWEIDEFVGDNMGLIVAELELEKPTQQFSRPSWIGPEVTNDKRYYNVSLVKNPYKNWN